METWRGNIKDYETLTAALDQLEGRCGSPRDPENPGRPRHVVCMDRSMTTGDTTPELRRRGYGYVLGERRSEVRKHWAEIDYRGWQVIRRDGKTGEPWVEVQEIQRQGRDRLIAVRSAGARQKERGIHERFLGRLKEDLQRLALRVASGGLKDPKKTERKVGRLQERYPGVSRWVTVELATGEQDRQRLEWAVKPGAEEEARAFEGPYLLRTNVEGTAAREVWEQYIHLVRIEQGIRTLKDVLKLRPVFHHKELRVEAHLFFTFLAYELLWALEWQHRSRGGELTGPRILEVLHQITLGTIAMITTEGQPLRLERIDVPAREQAEVLATLGIRLPRPRIRLEAIQLSLETA